MRTPVFAMAIATGISLLAAACSSSSNNYKPAATGTTAPASAATGSQPGGASVAMKASANSSFGSILTDAGGRALYLRTNDERNKSSCTGACAQSWAPLTITGKPTAGAGIDGSLLATITRDDGKAQVTFAGQPLYYFAADSKTGDVNGQNVNAYGGIWYLVSPAGSAIKAAGAASTPTAGGPDYGY